MDLDTRFRRARPGAEGYDPSEVDPFVAQINEALRHHPPTMAPWEVRDRVFRTQRMHRGYDEHDVDDFLDRAEQALRRAHGEGFSDPHDDLPAASSHRLMVGLVVLLAVTALVAAVLML